jgi:hypothetical protein
MTSTFRIAAAALGFCLLAVTAQAAPGKGGGGAKECDAAAVAAAADGIAAACPCAGTTDADGNLVPWKNHGQYVRCVAQATRSAVAGSDGTLQRRCLKESVRCSARSTCGRREGFVSCTRATTNGSSCSFRPSADACVAVGGEPGVGSCCAPEPVGSPSGAFVDGRPRL